MQVLTAVIERRRHPRTASPITAIVKTSQSLRHYDVSNLSASGALLAHGPDLPVREVIEIILQLPLYPAIRVHGKVVRSRRGADGMREIAVTFVHLNDRTEDHIQSALLSELERSHTDGVLPLDLRPS